MIVMRIMGGLGNQLFQYGFALVLADKGREVHLDVSSFRHDKYKRAFALDFLPSRLPILNEKMGNLLFSRGWLKRAYRSLSPALKFHTITDNKNGGWQAGLKASGKVCFNGYWQSVKLMNLATTLHTDFRLARDSLPLPDSISHLDMRRCVRVHARRLFAFDAKNNPVRLKNPPTQALPCDYYRRAFATVREQCTNPYFLIFGDDAKWCERHLLPLLTKDEAILMPPGARPDWQDMIIMSKCGFQIMANSSFSWWPAYLSDSTVFAPKVYSDHESAYAEIYPKEWILL